ncbi:MAG TPA: DUF3488 and transglutaminase-like domain-containing protein [Egibacteraceae bacterium]|nr:DUF3488 and transglutaminase-like domain-containing protein [Egibacteraceae bacterium]
MTAVAPQRPPVHAGATPAPAGPVTDPAARGPATPRPPLPGVAAAVACVALLLATVLPLDRVYADRSWVAPTVSAALLAFGVGWLARRLRLGPVLSVSCNVAAWALFSGLAFLPDTLLAGLVPTPSTVAAGVAAWAHGIELLQLRPAPAVPETGLVLITATGIWAVAHAVHELVFRAHAPMRAVLMAMVMWIVPLGLSPARGEAWLWAVPFLGAAALLLLAAGAGEAARWGRWSPPAQGRRRLGLPVGARNPLGWLLAAAAIAAGVMGAPLLPGWTDPALYELRDLGGSTTTTNPIVSIRASLLSPDPRPVLQVRTPRPVYLRTTSLDRYSDHEEWTNDGIRGTPFRAGSVVPFEVPIRTALDVPVEVSVAALDAAVLVPMPYQPRVVDGTIGDVLQYDQRLSTFTLNKGVRLSQGDVYAVSAAVPAPLAEQLDRVPAGWYAGELTRLPPSVPAEVAQLARDITGRAGAVTPFQQAMAIQEELRAWTYSLDPPSGHSGEAMRTFLRTRTGYCEQFAGTMAVMLRTLGIPARVGVGFTPGELADAAAGEYLIRSSNAHAWVEVLFPDEGWIAFEPTPRTDGNVLVPSPANLAPSATQAQQAGDIPDAPEADDLPRQGPERLPTSAPSPAATSPSAPGAGGGDGGGTTLLAAALLLLAFAGVGGTVLRRTRVDVDALGPAAQVLHAVAKVERVSAAMGRPRKDTETDREFLGRITRSASGPALAAQAERARYATELPLESITLARTVAADLVQRLLYPLDRRSRATVLAQVRLAELRERAARALPGRFRRRK